MNRAHIQRLGCGVGAGSYTESTPTDDTHWSARSMARIQAMSSSIAVSSARHHQRSGWVPGRLERESHLCNHMLAATDYNHKLAILANLWL
jgi:hypothetical protein